MAVGHGIFSSRRLCHVLYFYLILGNLSTYTYFRKSLSCNSTVLLTTIEANIVTIKCYGKRRRSTVKTRPLTNQTIIIKGTRLLLHAFFATLLLQLSGDVHTNPGPITASKPYIEKKRCLLFNARSLCSINKHVDGTLVSNLSSFQNMVYAENLDIVAVTETWLKDSIADKEILPHGYDILRKDRASFKRGGGVLLALRSDITYNRITLGQWCERLEIIAIEIVENDSRKSLVSVCYRPPNCDAHEWLDLFSSFLQVTENYDRAFITGDFNFPDLTWDSHIKSNSYGNVSANSNDFRELMWDLYLQQVNLFPTRMNNLIDLIFTKCPETVSDISKVAARELNLFSDHDLVFFDICLNPRSLFCDNRTVFNYRLANWDGLFQELAQLGFADDSGVTVDTQFAVDTSTTANMIDVDVTWQHWSARFLETVSRHIPTKTIRRRNTPPWFDSEVRHLLKKKETARRKAKSSGRTCHLEKYRALRRLVKQLISRKRNEFFQTLPNLLRSNPKQFWSVFKTVSNTSTAPNKLEWTNDNATATAENPKDIADLLNNYFYSMFKPPLTDEEYEQHPHSLDDTLLCEPLDNIRFTPQEVHRILTSLDIEKATGPDKIPALLLCACAPHIAPSLCHLFNKSVSLGEFPTAWKLSNIVPIPKGGSRKSVTNYRPISLLPIVSKVLERCVHKDRSLDHCCSSFT
ncbi:uncharacterized protein LOC114537227 [Dendronephthya gigantea]|uniref:uncharacterized protein LOC114537227 n=1 Tax=Dendronephthya gigantea TaxID=151771 RepID=UPI00106B4BB6|nr:uncharacterized protein LOC114537227 [Dendronephthya gigantea]